VIGVRACEGSLSRHLRLSGGDYLSGKWVTADTGVARIDVRCSGYSPDRLVVSAAQEIELHLFTDNVVSCARVFVLPALGISQSLPTTGETVVRLPAQTAGTDRLYTCSMGMYTDGALAYFQILDGNSDMHWNIVRADER
jgi:plastocyanin domain-containing protein